jgi:hypothetical protein
MQLQLHTEQEQELLAVRPDFEGCVSEVLEVQRAFLEMWDGRCEPSAWLETYVGGFNQPGSSEFLGSEALKRSTPDQYGPDHRPVGRIACARRGCIGCCYCHDAEALPVYLQVLSRSPPDQMLYGAVNWWVTVDELRREIKSLASCKHLQPEPLPVYLLERSAFELRRDGRAIFVAGNVRRHVSEGELRTWQEQLEPASTRLIILQGDSGKCNPDAAQIADIGLHLQQQAELLQDAELQWEATRKEKAELDQHVKFEVRRGCGLRVCWPGATSALRVGDLVYVAPPPDRSTLPGVAR